MDPVTDTYPGWNVPPDNWTLDGAGAHVWLVAVKQMEQHLTRLELRLPRDERQRANTFRFARDRCEYIVAHGVLRTLLGSYLGLLPHLLTFCYGPYGKPALVHTHGKRDVRFNLAHSHGHVVIGVTSHREIGVDIEYIQALPNTEQIVEAYLSPRERDSLRALPGPERNVAFFTCWSRKEAYTKAIGMGLTMPLDCFAVSVAPNEPARLMDAVVDQRAISRWSLQDLPTIPQYTAALAVEGHLGNLACWQWPPAQIGRLLEPTFRGDC